MVRRVRYIVFFDVGDGIGAFESGRRLRDCGVEIDTTQCLES